LNCDQINPRLGLEKTPFYINTATRPWIHGRDEPRRAGVNAFGFGGINAHVVLEEHEPRGSLDHCPEWDSEVCVLGAETPELLLSEVERVARFLESAVSKGAARFTLKDLAYSLNLELVTSGSSAQHRLALVPTSLSDLQAKLERAARKLA